MKDTNTFQRGYLFESSHPKDSSSNQLGEPNYPTKIQCQKHQLHHFFLEKDKNQIDGGMSCNLHLPVFYTIAKTYKIKPNVKQICIIHHFHLTDSDDISESSSYCPPVWDDFLCWPRTRSGEDVSLSCPMNVKGLDPKSKFFFLDFDAFEFHHN